MFQFKKNVRGYVKISTILGVVGGPNSTTLEGACTNLKIKQWGYVNI